MKNIALKQKILTAEYQNIAHFTDPNLYGVAGIAVTDNSIWAANDYSGTLTQYSFDGKPKGNAITFNDDYPIGIIKNEFDSFKISGNIPASLIISTEFGAIYAFNESFDPNNVYLMYSSSYEATFTGLTMANNNLYIADNENNQIVVLNSNWQPISDSVLSNGLYPFNDPSLPVGYNAFNIANIDGLLYVSYIQDPQTNIAVFTMPGDGVVNVFTPDGIFKKRLVTFGYLDVPYAIVKAPRWLGFDKHAILIGNQGDGNINAYDHDGKFLGKAVDMTNQPIVLSNLWGVVNNDEKLYYAASIIWFTNYDDLNNEEEFPSVDISQIGYLN
jgi:uncharacterized protein (TIGR03118 family)